MEVVVLPPQDALKRHHHHHHHHQQRRLVPRRNPNNPNPNNQTIRSNNRRRRNSNSPPPPPPRPASPTLSGPIRILKRGEDLSQSARPKPESDPVSPAGPAVVGPMFVNGFYAGSACVTSPAPSELPVPAFFSRSCGLSAVADDNNEKIADDLRRVLKLF